MGLSVIRALGENGVPIVAITYNNEDYGHFSKYVDWRVKTAHPEREKDQFIAQLIKLADRFRGGILIPASDESVVAVSQNIVQLEKYYVVACAPWNIVQRIIDKKHTYAYAKAVGVPIPRTISPKCVEEARAYSESANYPCLVKPRQSHLFYEQFGRKMVKAFTPEQLISAFLKAEEKGLEVMLQEFIPGVDSSVVNYNSYFWNNEPVAEFTAQQIRKAPPEIGAPCVVTSKRIPEIIEIGRKLIRAIGYYGFSCTEFKLDPRDKTYKLMEINGRYNLSGSLAVHCGVNFPWYEYNNLMEGAQFPRSDWKEGIYWIDFARDVTTAIRSSHKTLLLGAILRPYGRRHVIAEFSWKDTLPFIGRIFKLIKRFCMKGLSNQMRKPGEKNPGGRFSNENSCHSARRKSAQRCR